MNRNFKRKYTLAITRNAKKHAVCNEEGDTEEDGENEPTVPIIPILEGSFEKKVYRVGNHIYFKTLINEESVNRLELLVDGYNTEVNMFNQTCPYGKLILKPLYLHISSNGGEAFYSLLAYDVIKRSKVPIYTIIEGAAVSGGTIMSVAGVKRLMTPNSMMLIHEIRAGTYGKFSALTDEFNNDTKLMARLLDIYCENNSRKISRATLKKELEHDIYWTYGEAKAKGFIDGLYQGDEEYVNQS